jgi:hypothetical protein
MFEVFKWLLHHTDVATARSSLAVMEDLVEILYPDPAILGNAVLLLRARPEWLGTLEDAIVAQAALARDVPVWTFNYRDLTAFPNLQFWTPG